jgi:hypothetical protein
MLYSQTGGLDVEKTVELEATRMLKRNFERRISSNIK